MSDAFRCVSAACWVRPYVRPMHSARGRLVAATRTSWRCSADCFQPVPQRAPQRAASRRLSIMDHSGIRFVILHPSSACRQHGLAVHAAHSPPHLASVLMYPIDTYAPHTVAAASDSGSSSSDEEPLALGTRLSGTNPGSRGTENTNTLRRPGYHPTPWHRTDETETTRARPSGACPQLGLVSSDFATRRSGCWPGRPDRVFRVQ